MLEQEKLTRDLSRKKHLSIEKISKTKQTFLIYLLYKAILVGKSYKLDGQRILAKVIAKHYNSIFHSQKKLRKEKKVLVRSNSYQTNPPPLGLQLGSLRS